MFCLYCRRVCTWVNTYGLFLPVRIWFAIAAGSGTVPRANKMKELTSNSTTNISQARKAVEQLKMEAYMDRMKVSKAAAELLAYCDAHIGEDPLIIPVPASENPFREKKLFCTIL
ncbi:guanine nucleotide-binding protein G(I)/G(S)/G(O) subunit gamma-4 isoform X1 [Cyrtonyx montezumae]|uniref:guanine nucleotide-binding protein G(I)/G(S)/G(O) subunit gamma-4 isoform X1 n=1 Tax=Cyrtonyx montezumae TaxID=9017 RepID=UPI0032DA67DE